tara:strand:+ start:2256 stop:2975 length:720 start_codon:yes stop_codon:yes gene_type:complete
MTESSKELKTRIDEFYSRFASKEKIIVFEQSKFDVILGTVFNRSCNILLDILKRTINITMKVINKFFDLITQQNDLKKKILKQEEILINNSKLNAALSEQINLLNKKIDKISLKDDSKNFEPVANNINNSLNESKNKDQPNKEIEFFQNENLRISNELFETRKKFEIMKEEIEKFQNQRSSLIEKINSVNDVIQDSNIVTNVFENQQTTTKVNVVDPNNKINKKNIDINLEVSKIFNSN